MGDHPFKDDGSEPAFPVSANRVNFSGMSLRDYFAGQALVGFLASPNTAPGAAPSDLAGAAYELAAAMLAERDRLAAARKGGAL